MVLTNIIKSLKHQKRVLFLTSNPTFGDWILNTYTIMIEGTGINVNWAINLEKLTRKWAATKKDVNGITIKKFRKEAGEILDNGILYLENELVKNKIEVIKNSSVTAPRELVTPHSLPKALKPQRTTSRKLATPLSVSTTLKPHRTTPKKSTTPHKGYQLKKTSQPKPKKQEGKPLSHISNQKGFIKTKLEPIKHQLKKIKRPTLERGSLWHGVTTNVTTWVIIGIITIAIAYFNSILDLKSLIKLFPK